MTILACIINVQKFKKSSHNVDLSYCGPLVLSQVYLDYLPLSVFGFSTHSLTLKIGLDVDGVRCIW